jgi:hypothetical protein
MRQERSMPVHARPGWQDTHDVNEPKVEGGVERHRLFCFVHVFLRGMTSDPVQMNLESSHGSWPSCARMASSRATTFFIWWIHRLTGVDPLDQLQIGQQQTLLDRCV